MYRHANLLCQGLKRSSTLRVKNTASLYPLRGIRGSRSFSGSGAVILEDPGELLS